MIILTEQRIAELTFKYAANELTPDEEAELDGWLQTQNDQQRKDFYDRVDPTNTLSGVKIIYDADPGFKAGLEKIDLDEFSKITTSTPLIPLHPSRHWWRKWMAVAGIAVIFAVGAIYTYKWRTSNPKPTITATTQEKDLLPGSSNRAVLTLSDGRQVDLDSTAAGVVASQGNSQVKKLSNGQLVYEKAAPTSNSEKNLVFNTITIPRAGQYSLVLPDGSRVWLNSESSLRYPVSFSDLAREVELTGEAYFKIHKDKSKPFRVKVLGTLIEDIGTEFNVKAYKEEKGIKTTLVEGSAKVSKGSSQVILIPGQQVQVTNEVAAATNVDVDEVTAWKNGNFEFKGASIEAVMNELARWYDVDVEYQGVKPNRTYLASIKMDNNASGIIKILEAAGGAHFQIEKGQDGRNKIIVTSTP